MPIIPFIGFKNFRNFQDQTIIDLAPITILTGPNSSGKSSVLKAFQLLGEIDSLETLKFTSGQHKLGNFRHTVHNKDVGQNITFYLSTDLYSIPLVVELEYTFDTRNDLEQGVLQNFAIKFEGDQIMVRGKKMDEIMMREAINVNDPYKVDSDAKFLHDLVTDKNYYIESVYETCDLVTLLLLQREIILSLLQISKYPIPGEYDWGRIFLSRGLDPQDKGSLLYLIYHLIGISPDIIDIIKSGSYNETFIEDKVIIQITHANKVYESYSLFEYIHGSVLQDTQNPFFFTESKHFQLLALKGAVKASKYNLGSLGEDKCIDEDLVDDLSTILDEAVKCTMHETKITSRWGLLEHFISGWRKQLYTDNDNYTTQRFAAENEKSFSEQEKDAETHYFGALPKNIQFFLNQLIYNANPNGKILADIIIDKLRSKFDSYRQLFDEISKKFRIFKIHYLEAVRSNTQRSYTWKSQGTGFNDLLLEFATKKEVYRKDFVDKWLKEFGLKGELKIVPDLQGTGASIVIGETPLADLGYGMTQLLPILLKIAVVSVKLPLEPYRNNKILSQLLYIEEPETNLHPKLQSKLADLFIDAYRTLNIQIVIETHSEYLIRKLQYLTATNIIKPTDTVIHYFYDKEEKRAPGVPQVKKIEIKPDGRLTDEFGPGFYDETGRLMMAILTKESLN